jgi:L,D-transpeptidase catalytic domain/Ankyrin repeat
MKSTLSGQKWTLACLALCLAGLSAEILRAQDNLRFTFALLQLPQLAKPQISIDEALEEARQVREDRRRRMSFFEAIAANDQAALSRMLEEGMDPNAELPLPIPIEFQNRFSDKVLRYYVSGEEGFTGLMLATALRNHAFVKLLLQAGANPLKITKRHKTFALWLAARQNDIEIMRSLMGIGPDHTSQAYRITIDLLSQTASLWRNGKIILSTPISSGRRTHPTPRGRFLVTNKYRHWKSTLYPAKMPFFLRLSCGDFGLHMGALPGYPASHGCIRLPAKSAQRLYASVPIGTLVEIQ